jgi:hypothetical protein
MSYKDLFDIEYSIEKICDSRIAMYSINLKFNDLFNRSRISIIDNCLINRRIKFHHRISFTAISSISIQHGAVARDLSDVVEVLLPDGKAIISKCGEHVFYHGQHVVVFERFFSKRHSVNREDFIKVAAPLVEKEKLELLRIQSINVDFLDQDSSLFYRKSYDPFVSGEKYGTYLGTGRIKC